MDNKIAELENRIRELENKINKGSFTNMKVFDTPVKFNRTIDGSGDGLKLANAGDKVGFFGVAPVARQANIAQPSGGATIDSQSRSAINSILAVLDNYGFTN